MEKVLILCEVERPSYNVPHPEVGTPLPDGWTVLPVDSSVWLSNRDRRKAQRYLLAVQDLIIRAKMERE